MGEIFTKTHKTPYINDYLGLVITILVAYRVNVGYFLTIIEQKPNILMVIFMNHSLMNVI